MNIHGYKLKYKALVRTLRAENNKENKNEFKIQRLERAKKNCAWQIRRVRGERKSI